MCYWLIELIARGGMVVVWCVIDLCFDREVVVKVFYSKLVDDEVFCEWFRREVIVVVGFNYLNIVMVFDFGDDGEFYFIVMEFV